MKEPLSLGSGSFFVLVTVALISFRLLQRVLSEAVANEGRRSPVQSRLGCGRSWNLVLPVRRLGRDANAFLHAAIPEAGLYKRDWLFRQSQRNLRRWRFGGWDWLPTHTRRR